MAITTVIFDLGGVLVSTQWDLVTRPLADMTGRDPQRIMEEIVESDFYFPFMRGEIDADGFCGRLNRRFGLSLSGGEITSMWSSAIVAKPDVDDIVGRLRNRFKLALGSNTDLLHYARGREVQPIQDWFDYAILSYLIGACKPDPAFYLIGLDTLSASAEECVFIDDRMENVEAAQDVGITGILFESPRQLETDLKALGVL